MGLDFYSCEFIFCLAFMIYDSLQLYTFCFLIVEATLAEGEKQSKIIYL